MHSEPQIEFKPVQTVIQREWRAFGLVAACLLAVVAALGASFVEMSRIWQRSETFTHGFLVIPAFLYLVWLRRSVLATTPPRPSLPAVILVAGVGFIWLLGELASTLTVNLFAAVAMVPAVVISVLGWRWGRALAFPLAFLFFAVPFGEALVPQLMEWTADFTVLALQATGVPVLREGQSMLIPSGRWTVVEACSGIRYLIASMFVGALFSSMMYRSPIRQAVFFAASIGVPIIANWIRAYMIVMLGHLTDNRVAVGVDHLIYGWIFFGVVMMILFAVGAIWREDHQPAAGKVQEGAKSAAEPVPVAGGWGVVGASGALVAAVMLAWPIAAAVLIRPDPALSAPAAEFESAMGWKVVAEPLGTWRPRLQSATSEQALAFEKDGHKVGLYLGFYRNQRQGHELVNSMNVLVHSDDAKWLTIGSGSRATELSGQPLTVRTQRIRGADGTLVAWQWYWLGDTWTASDMHAKAALAVDRLLRRDDLSAWVVVYVLNPDDAVSADRVLDGFLRDFGSALDRDLRAVVGR
jgi:exosortase A